MIETEIIQLIEPSINAQGFELWGLDYYISKGKSKLQVFIEGPTKVTIEDCGKITSEISYLLDIHDIIKNSYILEVSSPGIDRKLYKPSQYKLYIKHNVIVNLKDIINQKRNIKGKLHQINDEDFIILIDNSTQQITIPFNKVKNAQLDIINSYKISKKRELSL